MKKFLLYIGIVFCPTVLTGQTILIDPSGEGGFETGNTFTANGWTVSNSINNPWVLGTCVTTSPFLNRSAYISYDSGTTNSYNNTASALNYFYRDITVPSGETVIKLTFDRVCNGESNWDLFQVFTAPTAVTPTGTTAYPGTGVSTVPPGITGATFIGYGNLQTTIQSATYYLPANLAGTTFRLIFGWKNDESDGINPAASIDNISLVSRALSPLHGSYSINNSLPTTVPMMHDGTGNFNNFSDAINYFNADGINAPVTMNITAGQIFNETPPAITTTGTISNPVTFQKNGTGDNPLIISGTGIGSADAVITLKGCDYVTFDGIDIRDNVSNTTAATRMEYGYCIVNISATDGAQNNTVKNCKIVLNRLSTLTKGLYQYTPVTPTNLTGCNSTNKYYNIFIENSYNGIYLAGYSSTYYDANCEIGTTGGGSMVIGGTVEGDIGGGAVDAYGIYANYQSGISIFNAEVRNVSVSGDCSLSGIFTYYLLGTCSIFNNKVHDIKNNNSSSTSAIYGIYGHYFTGTNVLNIYNNFIYGITSGYAGSASPTRQIHGIYIYSWSSTSQTYNILHNNVRIDGSASPNISSSCFEIYATSGGVIITKDNIFANFTGPQTGNAKHYCWVSPTAGSVGNTGSSSNYNDLYISNSTNGFVGKGSSTDYATLANWQSVTSQDANSKSVDPQFALPTDLHSFSQTLDGAATPVAWITTDIDGDTRNGSTPDIGADEYGPLVNMAYVSSTSTQTNTGTLISPSINSEILGIQIVTTGTLMPLNATAFTLNTNGTTSPLTDISNARLWTTGTSPSFATTTQFGSTAASPNGSFTFTGSLNLSPGVNFFWLTYDIPAGVTAGNFADAEFTDLTIVSVYSPTVSAPAGNRIIRGPLNGVYTIDPAGSGSTNYPSFASAIADLNLLGISGNVTFNVAGTTFNEPPLTITATGTSSASITFQKTGDVNPIVNFIGTAGANDACFRLYGADYLTFDGLTVQDDGNEMEYGFYFVGAPATTGCQNDTVKNCTIDLNRSNTASYGIYMYSNSYATNEANNNNKFFNNTVRDCYNGYYFTGYMNFSGENNEIGTISGGTSTIFNIGGGSSQAAGISASGQSGLKIYDTEIYNVSVNGSYAAGISVSVLGTCFINNNKIHNIQNTSASSTNEVYGISGSQVSGSHVLNIYNNFIYGITSGYSGTASSTRQIYGIILWYQYGSTALYNISYNSVRLDASSSPNISSTCFEIKSTTYGVYKTANNIFANHTGAQTGVAKHYCWVSPTAGSVGSTGSSSNFNDLYINNSINGFIGLGGTTEYATLASWQTATGQDANSKSVDPQFVSPADLHSYSMALDSAATPISEITTDIDGETRDASTPDIGADEYTPFNMVYTSCAATQANTGTLVSPSTNNEILGLQVVTSGSLVPINVTAFTLNTNGTTSPAADISNAKLWSTGSVPVFGTTTQFGSTVASPDGSFSFIGNVTLLPGVNYFWLTYDIKQGVTSAHIADAEFTDVTVGSLYTPVVSAPNGFRTIKGPLNGNYTIDPSGSGISNYISFSLAVSDLNMLGIAGEVVFDVANATFNEPPLTITATGSLTNHITFRKSGGSNPVVNFTGTILSDACFKLNGSDHITIDGLTIQDAGSAMDYGFLLSGESATNGCQNNTVKNCIIDMNKSNTSSYGVYLSSTASTSQGSNSNNKFYNNTVRDSYKGYCFNGASSVSDENNEVGTISEGTSTITNLGGGLSGASGITIFWQKNFKVHHTAINNISGTGYVYGIESYGSENTAAYCKNEISSITSSGSSYVAYGIYIPTGATHEVYDNSISAISATGVSSSSYGLYISGGTNNIYRNKIHSVTGYNPYGMYLSGTANHVYQNSIYAISTSATSSSAYGTYITGGTTQHFYQNSIHGISTTSNAANGVWVNAGTNNNIYSNTIFDVNYSGNSSYRATGLMVYGGTTNNVYNNFIYDIRAAASTAAPGVSALCLVGGGVTANIFFNTIFLNYTSTAASNQSAALYLSITTTPGTLNLRNNMFVNTSNMTTGTRAVAFYQTPVTLGNLTINRDNNLYYAGTPGTKNLIFYDGTNAKQTLAEYQSYVYPKEALSVTENPPFVSGTAPFDLHLNAVTATRAESGGAPVASVGTDFDGDTRNASYPDIGADEGNFLRLDVFSPVINYTALSNTLVTGPRNLTVTIKDASGVPQSSIGLPVLYWKINSGLWNGVQGVFNPADTTYVFSFGESAVPGDIVKYYVAAQDNFTTPNVACYPSAGASGFSANPPAVSTPPSDPSCYVIIQPVSGIKTIDNTNPTAGDNYNNFDDAIFALNNHGLAGAVTFQVFAGQTFPKAIQPEPNNFAYAIMVTGTATNTITFEKYGEGGNPVLSITGRTAANDIGMWLNGTDYITFNGINIADAGVSSSNYLEWGYYLQGPVNDNCHHVTIQNCTIDLNKGNANTIGIYLSSNAPASPAGGNCNNTISNNTIQDAYNGIYLSGNSSYPDPNNVITGNTIQNIGNNLAPDLYGLYASYQSDVLISNNVVNLLSGAGTLYGVNCSNLSGSNNIVSENTISNMTGTSTSKSSYGLNYAPASSAISQISGNTITGLDHKYTVYGMYLGNGAVNDVSENNINNIAYSGTGSYQAVGLSSSGGATNNICNNYIYDIKAPASTATPGVRALYFGGGTRANVTYNTVYLNYTSTVASNSSAALYVTTSPAVLNLVNNIIVNKANMTSGIRAVAFYKSSTSLTNLGLCNNNLYYAGTPGTKNLIYYDGTNSKQTLEQYQSLVSPKETYSVTENPPFVSASSPFNLHLTTTTATKAESGGTPVTGIYEDFDGDTRSTVFPDIGADEGNFLILDSCPPVISYSPLSNTPATGPRTLTAIITDPSGVPQSSMGLPMLYFKINSSAWTGVQGIFNPADDTYSFTFGGSAFPKDIVWYYVVAQDNFTSPNGGCYPSAGASGYSINPPAVSTPPASPSYYLIQVPIFGIKTIDNTNPTAGDNYNNFDDAIYALNNHVLAGAVTFNVFAGQTFPKTVPASPDNYAFTIMNIGTASNTITFQKYGEGNNPVLSITGSVATNDVAMYLNGTDYITFDGIDITDAGTGVSNYLERGYYLQGPANDNCNHVTIKNCTIDLNKTNYDTKAISCNSNPAASSATGNSYNTIANNTIRDTYTGIYMVTSGIYPDQNNVITGNTIYNLGNDLYSVNSVYGIYAYDQSGFIVSNNSISMVNGTRAIYGITCGVYGNNNIISGNTLSDFTGTSVSNGMYVLSCYPDASATVQISGNTLMRLNNKSNVYGISVSEGKTNNIFNNKIFSIAMSGTGAGEASALRLTGGTTNNIYNNFIYDIKAPASTATPGVSGLKFTNGGVTANVYYNTVYLNYVSTVSGNSSTDLYVTEFPCILNLVNNIFVNKCNMTTGTRAVAFQKSSTSLMNLGLCDNNLYYAGMPGTKNLIFYDGLNANQTLADFKNSVFPKESSSVTEDPPFVSNVSPYDLHLITTTGTICESGGTPVASVAGDYDGDPRNAVTPDIGADEFAGLTNASCSTPVPGITVASGNNLCLGQAVTLSLQNPAGGTGVHYQWQYSANNTTYTNIADATFVTCDVTPLESTYYQCVVTCLNGPVSAISEPLLVTVANAITGTTPGSRCGTGPVTLGAAGNAGTTINWYTSKIGGTSIGTGSPWTTPTISSTTAYYAAAEVLSTAPGTVTIGTGTIYSGSNVHTPYCTNYEDGNHQFLFTASELGSAGLEAGNITSLALNIYSVGTPAMTSFGISMGQNPSLNALTTTYETGLTPVFSSTSYTPAGTGWQTVTFSTPFYWDGISNLIVQICFGNNSTYNTSTAVYYSITPGEFHHYGYQDNGTGCAMTSPSLNGVTTSRPNMRFAGTVREGCLNSRTEVVAAVTPSQDITTSVTPAAICSGQFSTIEVTSENNNYTYNWQPGNLNGSLQIVYPESTTTYSVTATDPGTGCAAIGSIPVTVLPSPAPITITPPSPLIDPGDIQQLTVSGGQVTEAILFSENFNNTPNNWSTVNNSVWGTPANAAWTIHEDGDAYSSTFHSNDNSRFYMSNSEAQGIAGVTNTELISPVISTIGFSSLSLSFWHHYNYSGSTSQAKIEVSTDGGATWISTPSASFSSTQGSATSFVKAIVDMNGYINQSNLKFRFHYQDIYGYYWCIDNVELTGTLQGNFVWTPYTSLYTDPVATVAYNGENLATVYTKSESTITYSAATTYATTGCVRTQEVTVTVEGVPANYTASGTVLPGDTTCYNATDTLTVAGPSGFTIVAGGSATFIAGECLRFLPETSVQMNGYMHGFISTSYCSNTDLPIVAANPENEEQLLNLGRPRFLIFPNPTNGNCTLVINADQNFNYGQVVVYNINGTRIMSEKLMRSKEHVFITSFLPAGLYFVKIVMDGHMETLKLVKMR